MNRNDALQAGMREAMRQMRTGGLHEATATIQRTLRGGAPDAAPNSSANPSAANEAPIEGSFHVVAPDALPSPSGAKAYQRQEHKQEHARKPFTRFRARKPRQWGYAKPIRQPEPTPDHARPDRAREEQPRGQFISGSYSNSAGTRAYKLYIPSGYHGQTLPLIVMLHGCTQNPDDFAAGTRMNSLAEEHQCFIVYPQQASSANMNKCWNWFEAAHQQHDHGEPSIIAGLTRHVISKYPVDTRRVYVAGLSAGGAMAAIMGRTYPSLYAAIGVHSGLPYAVAHDMPSAFAAMNQMGASLGHQRNQGAGAAGHFVPTIVFHGDRDTTVHPRNGDEVIAQCATSYSCNSAEGGAAKDPQVSLRRGQVPNGHTYTRAVHRDTSGKALLEQWRIHEAGHAWSGGSPQGSYTDPKGPNASREMIRFFYEHELS